MHTTTTAAAATTVGTTTPSTQVLPATTRDWPRGTADIRYGGDYNPEIRRYRQNIVVYAVPIG